MTLVRLLLAAVLAVAPEPLHRPEVDAVAVLHAWDERRAEAWAAGDVAALRSLYTDGSPAGRADVAMLRAWRERGLRVEDMRMQLLRVVVRRAPEDRLVLVVTDRLASAVAVGDGVRVRLPQDRPSARVIVLRRTAGEWRVAQASPVRTTSSTVRSWNR